MCHVTHMACVTSHTWTVTATHCNNIAPHHATHGLSKYTLQHCTHYTTLQQSTTHCSTLQRTATQCNTLQHTATHCDCNINLRIYTHIHLYTSGSVHIFIYDNILQHTATNCSAQQHMPAELIKISFITIHYNTLQHTVTFSNRLQRTATHCST